ncbi:MAG: biopolymer transporter ExbD [Flavobacteriaceae bacterium]|jgi:biopolymer transport protein ExbD|nr:biopolymer transporter ExbD [Flavobacteriaceae bacterium]
MARVKPKRQKIHIDMTPMSDLAWLLLTFFILTTQFKKPEAVTIQPPSSVSTIKVQDHDVMRITVTPDGRYFFSMDDDRYRIPLLEAMGQKFGISFTKEEKARFNTITDFGVPIQSLKQYLALTPGQQLAFNEKAPGIPCDSVNTQLVDWVFVANEINPTLILGIKGDVSTQYPKFKNLLDRLQDKRMNKFQLITSAESEPIEK